MKKNCKIVFFSVLMLFIAMQVSAIVRPTTLYAYGFSASFSDSTVYFTEIQQIDSAWINVKTKFLYSRDSYSYQLKYYLEQKGVENPTCIISFAKSRKDAEKKYMKLRKKYTKDAGAFTVKYISLQDFQFKAISAAGDPNVVTDDSKEARKAEEAAEKQARKEAKEKAKMAKKGMNKGGRPQGPPPGGMPGGMPPGGGPR